MPYRIVHTFPVFYSQMKLALWEKAYWIQTMPKCSGTKIHISMPRWKCNTSSLLTSGQGYSEIICRDHPFSLTASVAQSTLFSYSISLRICCREYRPLCDRECSSCMMMHQWNCFYPHLHSFHFRKKWMQHDALSVSDISATAFSIRVGSLSIISEHFICPSRVSLSRLRFHILDNYSSGVFFYKEMYRISCILFVIVSRIRPLHRVRDWFCGN